MVPQQSRRRNLLLYRRGVIQATTGQFSLNGVAPGEYKLFAWENLPPCAEEVPEVLAEYEVHGRSVSIQPYMVIDDIILDVITYPTK